LKGKLNILKKLIRIHTEASSGHPRRRVIQKIYGEKFEHLIGDIVKPAHEGSTEQMIELILSFHSEYEDTPANVDVTVGGDEMKLILSDKILFDFSNSDIRKDGEAVIQDVAEWLEKEEYNGLIKVYGHTDSVDGDDINQPLSEDRAENVHSMLQTYLNHPEVYEFEVKGFEKYEPIAINDTEEGRERNHRVEILLQVESDTD